MQDFDAGCDPGITNWGVSFVDKETNTSLMMNVDLSTWDGKTHTLLFEDIGPCVHEFCLANKRFFDRTSRMCIELLPARIMTSRNTNKKTNPLVRDMMVMLAQTVHILYPNVRVYYASPASLRAFSGTSGGSSHAENKKLTFDKGTILPNANMCMAEEVFRDARGLHADPVEATGCAMILKDHADRFITSRYHKPGVIRKFAVVKYSSPVVYPKWKPSKAPSQEAARARRERTEKGVRIKKRK